jgi:transposase
MYAVGMRNTDARGLTHDKLTELRKRGVSAVQKGESPEDVARVLGVHRATVYNWLSQYRAGGWGNLDARKRGGRKRKLDAKAMAWVYRVITLKDPRQFKFAVALWTSKMIVELIRQRFDIALSKASVCRLLDQLGLSAQRPLWRAYQQDPAMVERWLKEDYPAIRAKAKRQKAEIWFADAAGVRSDAHAGTTWAPRGQTPIVSSTGARFGLNIISAVNPQGHFRFMCVDGRVNAGVFIDFLKRLVHNAPRKIFLVVDGHTTHKAKKVKTFVASVADRLELFFLPPYSPELNPNELVWNDLKNNAIGRKAITGAPQMKDEVLSFLHSLQKLPGRVRSYFRAPTTAYAGMS